MKYMGSKARFVNEILPIILKNRKKINGLLIYFVEDVLLLKKLMEK
jgi:hypothetical protein